ncbi:hypothetical protein BE20_0028 [Staphylococcus phage vB_SepS_BE20]|nr:hypothetical protein BE20_0028 [Staphylococcus phage vB_SepS_BE20]
MSVVICGRHQCRSQICYNRHRTIHPVWKSHVFLTN